jgi:hypothetical protein
VTASFSQTTYPKIYNDSLIVITQQQLKLTDKIFLEHEKLLEENYLFTNQIKNLEKINENDLKIDSLRRTQIKEYTEQIQSDKKIIDSLNSKVSKKDKYVRILEGTTIGGLIAAILLILLK